MKQTQHAQEKIRSEQMSTSNTVLNTIKKDWLLCNQDVKQCVFNSRDSVYSISSSLCRNSLQLEDRIRVMESFLDDENIVTIASINTHTISR